MAAIAIALAAAAAPAAADDGLPPSVVAAFDRAGVPSTAFAAVALPIVHAAPPWRYRADVPMPPASTMKIVTAAVALDRLGPNWRGRTELRSAAALVDGTLAGDLVLRGGADPELDVARLWSLLVDLRQSGVRRIDGDVLLDRHLFDPPRLDVDVPPFDDAPEFAYNVIPDALLLAGNLLPLELRASADRVAAATVPPLVGVNVDATAMTVVDAPCTAWDDGWQPATVATSVDGTTTRIALHGAFPRGCTQRTALQLLDRDVLADRLLRTLWTGLGGEWTGRARAAPAPTAATTRVLAQRVARPWGEVLRQVNQSSDNALARLLFLQLGAAAPAAVAADDVAGAAGRTAVSTTRDRAAAVVRGWMRGHGIATDGLVLDNGSGLSRSARISPWQLARVVQAALAGPYAPDLVATLPRAGVDGTLRQRFRSGPAAGRARLKTGTLANVVALAGVVTDAAGWSWAVAAIVEHPQALRARPALDAWIDAVAQDGPHGSAAARRPVGPLGDGP